MLDPRGGSFNGEFVSEASAHPDFTAGELSDLTATVNDGKSLVQQQFKDDVDIKVIVRRFGITGALPLGPNTGIYGDFTGILDYESAVERIRGAEERFMTLPADVRLRFDNDPGKLIKLAQELPEEEFEAMMRPEAVAEVVAQPGEAVPS